MGQFGRRRVGTVGRVIAIGAALAILLPAMSWHALAASTLLQPYVATSVGSSPDAVAIGDITGDGRADVVMTTWYANDPTNDYRLFVFAQTTTGQLAAPVSYATAASYGHKPDSVAIGDVTGDGLPDVVVGISGTGLQIFPQLATGGLGAPTLIPASDSEMVALGHLGGRGALDIAAIGWGTNTVSVFLNDGTGTFGSPQVYSVLHGGYDDLKVADVTGDGADDLVVMSGQLYADPNVSVLAQLPGGGFAAPATYSVGTNILTSGIGIGDVTGDGRADVVASYGGNQPASNIAVFAGTPAGTLASPVSYPSYDVPEPVAVADMDLDGHPDVVTLHGGWQTAGVYPGQASGTLGTEQLYPIPYASRYGPGSLAVGDINGDGWPDVAIADSNNGLVVLLNYGTTPPPSPSPSASPSPTPSPTQSPAPSPTSSPKPTSSPTPTPTPTPSQPPSAPQALTTSANLAAGVGLSWSPPANTGTSPVSGYRIYRGTASGTETFLASVAAATAPSYTDTAVADGTTYFYEVSAVSAAGESPMSTEAIANRGTPPSAPSNLTATAGKGQVGLAWTAPTSNGGSAVTGYDIYRGTSSGGETFLVSVGASTTSYTDAGLTRRIRYYYRVTALNALGESAPSAEVSAVPK